MPVGPHDNRARVAARQIPSGIAVGGNDNSVNIIQHRHRFRRKRSDKSRRGEHGKAIAGTVVQAFTIADAYLFTILNWSGGVKVDLAPWPSLQQFQARVAARPKVHAALVAEGLVKVETVAA